MKAKITADLLPLARPISELTHDPRNARLHGAKNLAAIRASLERFGQRKPVVVRRSDGRVLAGNGTMDAALAIGWTHLACVMVDDTDPEAVAYGLADNRTAELADWNEEVLAQLMSELEAAGAEEGLGWTDRQVEALLADAAEARGEDPGAEPPPAVPVSVPGKVYQLGPHRLACGDSTNRELVAALYGEDRARMVWTDPPYGVAYAGKNEMLNAFGKGNSNQTPIEGDDASPEEVAALIASALGAIPRMPGAALYVACANCVEMLDAAKAGVSGSGFHARWTLAWIKDNAVLGRADYMARHETILYGWAPDGPHLFHGHHRQTTFEVPKPRSNGEHPTMKPVALIEPMIVNSSNPGDVVGDPFGGSGSTLIACAMTGRVCRTQELSPAYCDVIRRRWAAWALANGAEVGDGITG